MKTIFRFLLVSALLMAQLALLFSPTHLPIAQAQASEDTQTIAAQVAATPIKIKVTTTSDEWSIPGNTNEAVSSKCSLREALQAVVGNVNGNQGCGNVAPNETEYVLDMLPGTYKLTKAANKPDELPNLVGGKKVTIDGFKAVTIDGNKSSGRYAGIFKLTGRWLVLKNITMQRGK